MFEGTRLKIDRAKKHINELNTDVTAYLAREPFELVFKKEATRKTWIVKTKIPIPLSFSGPAGDALHNLRAALDHVVFEMIGDKAKSPEAVSFPFCKDAASYVSSLAGRQIQLAGIDVLDYFNTLRPYPGGDNLLYGLHAMDITDKHKVLLDIGRVSDMSADDISKIDPDLNLRGPGILRMSTDEPFIVNRHMINRELRRKAARDKTVLYEKPNIQPTFHVCFGKGEAFAHHPAVPKLYELANRVEEITDNIISRF